MWKSVISKWVGFTMLLTFSLIANAASQQITVTIDNPKCEYVPPKIDEISIYGEGRTLCDQREITLVFNGPNLYDATDIQSISFNGVVHIGDTKAGLFEKTINFIGQVAGNFIEEVLSGHERHIQETDAKLYPEISSIQMSTKVVNAKEYPARYVRSDENAKYRSVILTAQCKAIRLHTANASFRGDLTNWNGKVTPMVSSQIELVICKRDQDNGIAVRSFKVNGATKVDSFMNKKEKVISILQLNEQLL